MGHYSVSMPGLNRLSVSRVSTPVTACFRISLLFLLLSSPLVLANVNKPVPPPPEQTPFPGENKAPATPSGPSGQSDASSTGSVVSVAQRTVETVPARSGPPGEPPEGATFWLVVLGILTVGVMTLAGRLIVYKEGDESDLPVATEVLV